MIKAHRNSETEAACTGSVQVCTRSLEYILWLLFYCFYGLPECVDKWISFLCLLFGSFPCVCLIPMSVFVLFYYYPLEACCFLRDRKGVDPDGRGSGEELGGVEGGEINQDILCEIKIYF